MKILVVVLVSFIITAVPTIVSLNSSGNSLMSLNIKNRIIITEPKKTPWKWPKIFL